MIYDRTKLYDCADDYFFIGGSGAMPLTPKAAIDVCKRAVDEELIILGVDGGKWHNPGFQPDGASMWDSRTIAPVSIDVAIKINFAAVEEIRRESESHDVFIVTSSTIKGHWKQFYEMLRSGSSNNQEISSVLGLPSEFKEVLNRDTVTVYGPQYCNGKYVIVNNRNDEIVHISDDFDPSWGDNDRIRLNIV